MKIKILLLSLTMSVFPLNINTYFATENIYEKDNHFILLLGDIHLSHNNNQAETIHIIKKQQDELIENIKKYQKQEILTIVENPRDPYIYNKNKKIKNILDNRTDEEIIEDSTIILFELPSNLEKENIRVKNVEYRYMELMFALDRGNITTKDIADEMTTQISKIKEYEKEVLESNFEYKQYITDFYNEQITSDKIKDYLSFLKLYENKIYTCSLGDIASQNPSFTHFITNPDHIEKMQILLRTTNLAFNPNYSLFDISIVHNIIKNREKEIIVICAGVYHTLKVSKVLENIGYTKLTEHEIPDILEQICNNPEQPIDPARLSEIFQIEPVNVKKFFEPIFANSPYA